MVSKHLHENHKKSSQMWVYTIHSVGLDFDDALEMFKMDGAPQMMLSFRGPVGNHHF